MGFGLGAAAPSPLEAKAIEHPKMTVNSSSAGQPIVSAQYGQCRLTSALSHYWELQTPCRNRSIESSGRFRRERVQRQNLDLPQELELEDSAPVFPIDLREPRGLRRKPPRPQENKKRR